MSKQAEATITTRREGAILEVTLDRPKANAIDLLTSRVMGRTFAEFRDDPELRIAILKTAGDRFFCAGWEMCIRDRVTPFILAMAVTILALILFPALALWLPKMIALR